MHAVVRKPSCASEPFAPRGTSTPTGSSISLARKSATMLHATPTALSPPRFPPPNRSSGASNDQNRTGLRCWRRAAPFRIGAARQTRETGGSHTAELDGRMAPVDRRRTGDVPANHRALPKRSIRHVHVDVGQTRQSLAQAHLACGKLIFQVDDQSRPLHAWEFESPAHWAPRLDLQPFRES